MKKISKTMICALIIPAAPAFAVQGVSVPPAVRNVAVTSMMTERLSETAAGLAAAQEAGDGAKTETLLARLYAGGALKESAAPVYSTIVIPAPASGNTAPVELGALPAQAPASVAVSTAAPAAAAPAAVPAPRSSAELAAAARDAAAAAAKEEKEEAAKLKMFKSGVGMMVLALLLMLLLL